MVRRMGAYSRLRAKDALPILAALGLHAALLLLFISWRPPPYGRPTAATNVILVSGRALAGTTHLLLAPLQSDQIKTSSERSSWPIVPDQPSSPAADPRPAEPPKAGEKSSSLDGQAALKTLISAANLPRPDLTATPLAISDATASTGPSSLETGSSKTCQMLETLQAGLRGSVEVQAAITALPREARSVSNAVLLWNGRWLDLDVDRGGAALQPIQRVVMQIVGAAPLSCRTEIIHGPRLVFLGDARDTLVLAFGSGDWRWAEVEMAATPSGQK